MHPKISVITPSFNQCRFIEETIKSVLAQNYPGTEHIIVDGGSTDGTLDILRKYPHLTVIAGPDGGQANAVNKGLSVATGQIIGWLNSDDTYFPEVFEQVADTIDPAKSVFIAMGRCAFVDEEGRLSGKEHPSAFVSHREVVKIWKLYTIPQPAVFFHRAVYKQCGGLDEDLYFGLDYDLFLRYTGRFHIHCVNRLWATYRLHASSKSMEISQGDLLEKSLKISRRYWGPRSTLSYWKYLSSYLWYGGKLGIISLKKLNMADRLFHQKEVPGFLWNLFLSFVLFPPTIVRYLILPRFRKWAFGSGG